MALPFDKKKEGSMAVRVEPQVIRRQPDEEEEMDHLDIASEDLIHALKSGDVKGVSLALRSAFDLLESEPHEEFDHKEYDEYEGEE